MFIWFAFVGCYHDNAFEKEVEIRRYLHEVHHHEFIGEQTIILLQINICGACTQKTISFLENNFNDASRKIIILSEMDDQIFDLFSTFKNTSVYVDDGYLIQKYGLRISTDILLKFKNEDVVFWSYLNDESIRKYKLKNGIH